MEKTVTKSSTSEEYRARMAKWLTNFKWKKYEERCHLQRLGSKMNSIIRLAIELGWQVKHDEEQIAEVRQRWQKLKGLN